MCCCFGFARPNFVREHAIVAFFGAYNLQLLPSISTEPFSSTACGTKDSDVIDCGRHVRNMYKETGELKALMSGDGGDGHKVHNAHPNPAMHSPTLNDPDQRNPHVAIKQHVYLSPKEPLLDADAHSTHK